MAYSARLRKAIGAVRASLAALSITSQGERFRRHGEHEPDADAPLVLVACSGGRDSMALAALSHIVCASLGVRCGAVVVDHQLQEGSAKAAADAAQRCHGLGLEPVEVRTVDIDVQSHGHGEEAAARDARYEAIIEVARETGASVVFLAHTQDDQAETVLIGLAKSSGIDAIAGMPPTFTRDGVRFARPLLDVTREETTGICEDLGLDWWDDPTNGDAIPASDSLPANFPLRSKIRHTLVPYLNTFFSGDVASHLADATRLAQQDKDYLDSAADAVYDEIVSSVATPRTGVDEAPAKLEIRVDALVREHPAIRRRVIGKALSSLGIPFTSRHVERIDELAIRWHGQGPVSLPSGYTANRQRHVIRVCENGTHADRGCTR
ncbi:tRNA lysidine(34) synthetase TilS [Bifidobacterium sp. ESL0790]|uniref:tRNA lysidine(34) synthetase TilS n=1 Tax=Bifidobacterium sp. ESL0790 TaxID=2983233 RepID=UPI0023F6E50F|nr:tRNA lysidine(34) synthetase TilS [Bifidobacterium sp. ESL0790]WEV72014.1 tRNA lysidine(34) synthetase TilS [Bifidobacterium sp. ESL0790]